MTPEAGTPSYPAPLPSSETARVPRRAALARSRRPPGWLPRGKVQLFLVGAVLLGLTAVIAAPIVAAHFIRTTVLPRVSQRLGARVDVGDVTVRPTVVRLRDVAVHVFGKDGARLLDPVTVKQCEIRFRPLALLRGRIELTEVRLEGPTAQLLRGGDDDNITALLRAVRERGSSDGATPKDAGSRRVSGPTLITVVGAQADVRDDAGVARVTSCDAELRREGASRLVLRGASFELTGGATASADEVEVRFQSVGRFLPAGLPDIAVKAGAVVPWKRLAMTGIKGTIRPDPQDPARAVIALSGGYGGVDKELWLARGWVRPEAGTEAGSPPPPPGTGGPLAQWQGRGVEAELHVRAERFRLSSVEQILRDTPIIDADQTEVGARMDLRFAQRVLSVDGEFDMSGLSVFTPRLVAEPVRNLGFHITARGRADLKTRRFRLEKAQVAWNGAQASLEAEAEAQPPRRLPAGELAAAPGAPPAISAAPGPGAGNGAAPPGVPAGPGWRERWRWVSMRLVVPPLSCQALLDAMPPSIVPHIRDFKLAGTFQTDVRLFVDFAKLLRLPAPPREPGATEEEEAEAMAAAAEPAMPAPVKRPARRGPGAPAQPQVKDPKDDPVQISGSVGIDGCRVTKAPEEMDMVRLLSSFEHAVLVEPDRELRFTIGPENPDFVPFEEISPYLISSIMTTEDNGFLRHRGFIVPEFRSALQSNLERGYFRLGASSITMQLVKNVLLSREKTLSRKLQEMFLTWYMEQNLTKDQELIKALAKRFSYTQYRQMQLSKQAGQPGPAPPVAAAPVVMPVAAPAPAPAPAAAGSTAVPGAPPAPGAPVTPFVYNAWASPSAAPLMEISPIKKRILEIYFNAIEFGPYLYGIGKATRHYFGKAPKDLTPREAVWFSSILPNPKRRYIHYCHGAPDEKWEKYLDRILRRVHERGRLSDAEFAAAMVERFTFDREEALPEKDCLALILRMTEPAPPGTPPPDLALNPPKLPPMPPWALGKPPTVIKPVGLPETPVF